MTGPRIGGLLGQPSSWAVVAGLVVGIAGGSVLVGTGQTPGSQAPPAGNIALLACPGSGAVLANVPVGASLLVTGRSADGQWLEAYLGEPGVDYAWAPAADVRLASPADALPAAVCGAAQGTAPPTTAIAAVVTAAPGATVSPTAPLTAAGPTPTLQPTVIPIGTPFATSTPTFLPTATPTGQPTATLTAPPTATPSGQPTATASVPPTATASAPPTATPTPAPTIEPGPSLSGLTPSTFTLDSYSGCGPTTVYWTVTASDPDGAGAVTSVILHYTIGGTTGQLVMSTIDGGTSWETTNLGYSSSWPNASMSYHATATDQNGLTFQTSQGSINVVDCTAPSLSGLTANPQCIGSNYHSDITVTVTDPDDPISSVKIGVTPPWNQATYTDYMSHVDVNTWTYTIYSGTGGPTESPVKYEVIAQDSHGNTAKELASSVSTDPSFLDYFADGCLF